MKFGANTSKYKYSGRLVRLSTAAAISASVFFNGCADYRIGPPDVGVPPNELSTVGLSAVTGAVFGAGLGTLIGASSGNAGEGFVLGSLAGAAAGGAIGAGLDEHEQAIVSQRETLGRQEETIERQRRELDSLREQLKDDLEAHNRPSSVKGEYSLDNYQGNPEASRYKPAQFPAPDGSSQAVVSEESLEGSVVSRPNDFGTAKGLEYQRQELARSSGGKQQDSQPRGAEVRADSPDSQPSFRPNPQTFVPGSHVSTVDAVRQRLQQQAGSIESEPSPVPTLSRSSFKENANLRARLSSPNPERADNNDPLENTQERMAGISQVLPEPVERTEAKQKVRELLKKQAAEREARLAAKAAPRQEEAKIRPRAVPAKTETVPIKEPKSEEAEAEGKPETNAPLRLAKEAKLDGSTDPGCIKAQQEAKKAQGADSAADRLFYFRRALRFCPSEASYHVEIGKIYASIGRVEDAKFEFNQALGVKPNFEEAKLELKKIAN